jgi:hypothetical protein
MVVKSFKRNNKIIGRKKLEILKLYGRIGFGINMVAPKKKQKTMRQFIWVKKYVRAMESNRN